MFYRCDYCVLSVLSVLWTLMDINEPRKTKHKKKKPY